MKKTDTDGELKWYEKKAGRRMNFSGAVCKDDGKKAKGGKRADTKSEYKAGCKYERKNEGSAGGNSAEGKDFHKKVRGTEKKSFRVQKDFVAARQVDFLLDAGSVPSDAKKILADFRDIIGATHPLNSKQRADLPRQILELSHTLTDERAERRLGYMNRPQTLSAYTHYYLWWNLVRLTRLFSNLPSSFFEFPDGTVCLDVGSGPLTVPIALFLSRPELRKKKLRWYCMDISPQALSIGENLLMTVAARLECESWEVVRVKGGFGTPVKEKVSFVTCANVFNEVGEESNMPPDYLAKKYCEKILSYIMEEKPSENGAGDFRKVLLIEPGIPSSARLLSLMRDAMIRRGFSPVSPCPHAAQCPMDGKRGGKWCNFAFGTQDAPAALKKLSESARLPKERAVLSFVALTAAEKKSGDAGELSFRVASDPIHLPGSRTGYYACSEIGLLLVVTEDSLRSGECLSIPRPEKKLSVDEKSGAFVVEL